MPSSTAWPSVSARNAWAVGGNLILHWNGKAWQRQRAPAGSYLDSVAAISARSAWAVGATGLNKILILRWNGTAWRRAPTPNPVLTDDHFLTGVAATSAR